MTRLLKARESGVVILILLVSVVFTTLNGHFASGSNASTLLVNATVVTLLAIGQSFVLLSGNIDLSTGALVAFGGVLAALLINAGMPWPLAVVVTAAVTASAGLLSGLVVHFARIPSFLVTFGMLGIGETLALVLSNDTAVPVTNVGFASFGSGTIAHIPAPVIMAVAVCVVAELVQRKTVFGWQLYALGGNRRAAELTGVRVAGIQVMVFVVSGLLAGLAGALDTSRLMSGYPAAGTGPELFDSIAAAVIGGVSLFGGVGTAVGALLGGVLIGTVQDGMNVLALSYSWQPMVIGLIIVVGVAYDTGFRRWLAHRRASASAARAAGVGKNSKGAGPSSSTGRVPVAEPRIPTGS